MSDPLKWGSVGELNHVDWDAIVGELSPTLVAESGYNLHGLDLQSMAYEDVYAATMEAFPNIPVPCTRLKVGTILHRARPNENSRPYSRIKDITAPCSEKILKINRANSSKRRQRDMETCVIGWERTSLHPNPNRFARQSMGFPRSMIQGL